MMSEENELEAWKLIDAVVDASLAQYDTSIIKDREILEKDDQDHFLN